MCCAMREGEREIKKKNKTSLPTTFLFFNFVVLCYQTSLSKLGTIACLSFQEKEEGEQSKLRVNIKNLK